MNSLLERQTRELEHNLADLYINNNCDRLFRQANIDSPYESSTDNVLSECWTDNNGNRLYWSDDASVNSYSIVIDFHDRNEQRYTQKQRNYRCNDWHRRRQTLRQCAQDALLRALCDTRNARRVALKGSSLYAERQNLNATIKSLLKRLPHPASIDPAVQRPQFYNNLFTWYEELTLQMGCYRYYSIMHTLSSLSVSKNDLTVPATSDFTTALYDFTDCAYRGYLNKYGQRWEKVVWHNESWFTNSKCYTTHALHASTAAPSLLAYTSCGDKLMRNIQTQTKPGRYLRQFFSDILSEKDIRYWAERQQSYVESSELKLVPNTDPDGWVWVYEHPSGFSSCMQYDHSSRYLDNRLGPDTPYHPVRVYCHPDNHLALAYLGDDYKQFPQGRVYARAIVNTERKTWVRIYGDSRIQHHLERAGYSYDSGDTLKNEKLQKIDLPWGGYAMPYLDGSCITVDEHCDYFKVLYDGEYDAQNSSGMMDSSGTTCPCCGDTVDDEDDLTYVEHRGESICQSCLDDRYRYAYGRRGCRDYYPEDDCVQCESDHEWYVADYASDNDVYECEISGNYYIIDDLSVPDCGDFEGQYVHCDYIHELPDGETCCIERYEDDFDELVAAHSDEDEEEETPDEEGTEDFPCAPVISATEPEYQQAA